MSTPRNHADVDGEAARTGQPAGPQQTALDHDAGAAEVGAGVVDGAEVAGEG
jgi:hypothetical protein